MGVKYSAREEPQKLEKRGKGASSEDPVSKKRKVSAVAADSPKAPVGKPPRPPSSKVSAPRKCNRLDRYLRGVPCGELCSRSFMRELEETISYFPLRGEPIELYLDQFGSLLSGPDSVGDVVVKLHQMDDAGGRLVNMLDLGDEDFVEPVSHRHNAMQQ